MKDRSNMINEFLGEKTEIPKPLPQQWNLVKYHCAIKWWESNLYGTGHFNDELYKRIVDLKNR